MACACHRRAPAISRRALLSAVAAAGSLPLTGCDLEDSRWLADLLVPPELERELGDAAFREILAEIPVARDAGVQRRVAAVGRRVVEAASASPTSWEFVVLARDEANAFALPGGRVGVFTGMLGVAANEAQLATVLGHEVGHVLARHAAQRILADHALRLVLRAVAGLLEHSEVPIPPELVVTLGAGLADLGLIRPFSRRQELEADRLGVGLMAAAGYDPAQSIAFWERMTRLGAGQAPPAFLSTHPSSAARIEQLRMLVPTLPAGPRPVA
jgi:predicted Zn-dependent protease